jgi:hypothetical protein
MPIIVCGGIIAVFVFIFWLVNAGYGNYSINHEIDAVSLATLCVNIIIAFILQYYFFARASDDRAEKDILIENLQDVLKTLRACRDEIIACRATKNQKITVDSQRKIFVALRNLSNGLDNLETAVEMSGCSALTKEFEVIQTKFFDYRKAATEQFPDAYERSDITYQEKTHRELNKELLSLGFKVNRHR